MTPPITDDYTSTTSTTGTVSVGGTKTGSIETAGDTDWFKISLVAGVTYTFDAMGSPSGKGTLADTYLRLRDGAGTSIAFDDDSGTGYDSRITFTASSSGTYFLSAGSASSTGIGTYTVSAADVPVIPPTGAVLLSTYPVSGNSISQGSRDNDDTHKDGTALKWGYDFKTPGGSEQVHAVASGTVVAVQESLTGSFLGYGNVITVRTDSGFYVTYAHLSVNSVTVGVNDRVNAGDVIAMSGSSGTPTGHLHIQFGSIASPIRTRNGDDSTLVLIADGSSDVEAPAYFPKLVMVFASSSTASGQTDTNYYGTLGIDEVTGNALNNLITGYVGNDILRGAQGSDTLRGGVGSDALTGGIGSDRFAYQAVNQGGDSIKDFTSGADRFVFTASAFGGGAVGQLTSTHFFQGSVGSVTGSGYQFVYDASSRTLSYDSDGAGAASAVNIATLQVGATLSIADLWLM